MFIVPKDHNDRAVPGNEIIVYAIAVGEQLEFVVQEDKFPSAPSFVPASEYEIIDGRMSKFWIIAEPSNPNGYGLAQSYLLTFRQWAESGAFYERLVNGEIEEVSIWQKYQNLISIEFAPPSLLLSASCIEGGWLQCANCMDAWQDSGFGELAICPKCHTQQKVARSAPDYDVYGTGFEKSSLGG